MTETKVFAWIVLDQTEKRVSDQILAQGVCTTLDLAKSAIDELYSELYDGDTSMIPVFKWKVDGVVHEAEDDGSEQYARIAKVILDAQ